MYRPENAECIECQVNLEEALSRRKTRRVWLYFPSRAYEVKSVTTTCGSCGTDNHYDGLDDHIFNSASGTLWHHALLNMKTTSILVAGVTGCGWSEIMANMYIDTGSPADFPTQQTMMKGWLQYVTKAQAEWWHNLFIDPFCDRAVGTRIPEDERNPEAKVSVACHGPWHTS